MRSEITSDAAGRLVSVGYLRGLAALAVVLYHIDRHFHAEWLTGRGYVGIDVFFLLSGFLMHQVTAHPGATVSDFIVRRFFRLVPLCWLAVILWAPYIGSSVQNFFLSMLFIPLMPENPPQLGLNILGVLWTVGYELWFYAIFAASLAVSRRHRSFVAAAIVITTVVGMQVWVSGKLTLDPKLAAVFFPISHFPEQFMSVPMNPLMLEFVEGMMIAILFERFSARVWAVRPAFRIAFAVACTIGFAIIYRHWARGGSGVLTVGIGAPLLVLGALAIEPELAKYARALLSAPFQILGNVSFSLYLCHYPILVLLEDSRLFAAADGSVRLGVAVLVLSLLASWGIYVWLEKPCIRLGKQISQRLARKTETSDTIRRKVA